MVKQSIVALLLTSVAVVAQGSEMLLLDFTSPHCGPCQQIKPMIRDLASAGYPVREVDVTQEQSLAARFNVSRVPCLVMLANGREVAREVGAVSRRQLEQMFQQAEQSTDPPIRGADARLRAQSPDTESPGDPWGSATPAAATAPSPGLRQAMGPGRDARPAEATAEPAAASDTASRELIGCSVRLRVDDASGHSYGTGTIIDARSGEALIITCGHLFRESKGEGPVKVELFATTEEGVHAVREVAGQVMSHNLDRDLGLVRIRTGGEVRTAPVAPAEAIVERGDRVMSVGCDHGENPTALDTYVTATNRYQGPPNIEASGAPVEGRSGGGLFNDQGELIGVCFAADYEGNEGLYAAIESIHDELDRVGLSEIYRSSSGPKTDVGPRLDQAAAATVVRGQEPAPRGASAGSPAALPIAASGPAGRERQPSASLDAAEQAALEEIMGRASSAEVICIIRPQQPGGKSEVITLDGVSPQFVRALSERAAGGGRR